LPVKRKKEKQVNEKWFFFFWEKGQKILQASSDVFLGHSQGMEKGRYFYWRQMKDMKGAVVVDKLKPVKMAQFREKKW
jgi:hypothetical protein